MPALLEVVQLGAERERCRLRRMVEAIRVDHDQTAPLDECAEGYDRAISDVLQALGAG